MKQLVPGVLFAALWASASAATKFGLAMANPFALANVRFLIAGGLMLVYTYTRSSSDNALPKGKEWKQLLLFSLLNTTIYLSAFVLALKEVSAGIGSLSTATTPLFITLLSALWLKRRLYWYEWCGLVLGLLGVVLAAYPLLHTSYVTAKGLIILLGGMLSVAAATVYYASVNWRLPNIVINGWQVLLGGICLLPFTLSTGVFASVQWNMQFWLSVLWLIIPVSIIGLQLWFYLVRKDAVHASLWLFLCPIFGFIYAALLLKEPISIYTYAGTLLVIAGLYLAQHRKWHGSKDA
jgi:drug/metabolite transporter (DMT)-like permease